MSSGWLPSRVLFFFRILSPHFQDDIYSQLIKKTIPNSFLGWEGAISENYTRRENQEGENVYSHFYFMEMLLVLTQVFTVDGGHTLILTVQLRVKGRLLLPVLPTVSSKQVFVSVDFKHFSTGSIHIPRVQCLWSNWIQQQRQLVTSPLHRV